MIDMAVIGPSKGTRPERIVIGFLRGCGLRVRANHRGLPGSPDAWLPDLDVAVFVDGRFWHDPRYVKPRCRPHHRTDFYAKALSNRRRDAKQSALLNEMGISVIRIWDSSISKRESLATFLAVLTKLNRRRRQPFIVRI